jgi:hypothetical protein
MWANQIVRRGAERVRPRRSCVVDPPGHPRPCPAAASRPSQRLKTNRPDQPPTTRIPGLSEHTRTRRGETSLRTERWVAAPKPRWPHLNSMSANPPHARSRRNRTRVTETRQTWPPSHARHPRAPTTRRPAGMHGSKLTTPDALERGLRLATRAIVRVRTRFDVRGPIPRRESRGCRGGPRRASSLRPRARSA